ncbi:response regulator transcription factor [Holzapfeliella sp. JNUCC 72]
MIKILVVEDEQALAQNIERIVSDFAQTTVVYDGAEGLFEAESGVYDLVILDLMLPEMNGYEVLAQLRQTRQTPVLILTAKDGLEDKIEGFQKGADDYLTKPFHREELIMRVKALLKRSLGVFNEETIDYDGLSCLLASKQVRFKQEELPIQGKEFELLVYLIQNQDIILTKEQIFDRIWGFDSETTLTVVEVYMSRLRKHLAPTNLQQNIQTLRNVGYIMKGTN